MTIDKYQKLKNIYDLMRSRINHARGLDEQGNRDPNNDKANICFSKNKIWDGDLQVHLHMSYGYYGSSSAYDCHPNDFSEYIIKALNKHKSEILDTALKLCEDDVYDSLIKCKAEIEKISKEIEEAEVKLAELRSEEGNTNDI